MLAAARVLLMEVAPEIPPADQGQAPAFPDLGEHQMPRHTLGSHPMLDQGGPATATMVVSPEFSFPAAATW